MRGLAAVATLTAMLAANRTAQAAPNVVPIAPAALHRAVARLRPHIVLVNFWATWCSGCVHELPALARLQQEDAARGLRLVLVSADSPAPGNRAVGRALARRGFRTSYLLQGDVPTYFAGFDSANRGALALPITYLYDRHGRLVRRLSGEHSLAQYEALVAPLLAGRRGR